MDDALFRDNERTGAQTDETRTLDAGPLHLMAGGHLPSVNVAYQTWGTYNGDNAVLVCHAISGNSNAVFWWDRLVGPGKAIDTDRFFVVCSNALGGCAGTTGPSSLAPDGKRWGSRFPAVQVGDMVEVQARLAAHLGVPKWALVCGGSMGGMQALEWSLRFPDQVERVWMTASCARHSAMQIAFNEAARQAVLRDPKWAGGDYAPDDPPVEGLAVARMIGHLSYLSDAAFQRKFGRRLQDSDAYHFGPGHEFQVESYLSYQGEKFTTRFDPASLVTLSRAIDYFDRESLSGSKAEYLFTSFTSDWLYPTWQSAELVRLALTAGCRAWHEEIDVDMGHDAFLLDDVHQAKVVQEFLE